LECIDSLELINGVCVIVSDSGYFYPVLILSLIWLIVSAFVSVHWKDTRFLTMCIVGVSVCEVLLWYIELAAFSYYHFSLIFLIIGGIVINIIVAFIKVILLHLAK
jgi:hypothetical protein